MNPQPRRLSRRTGALLIRCLAATAATLAPAAARAQSMFARPESSPEIWQSLLGGLQYVFYGLYLVGVLWVVQAWHAFKEGDTRGMGTRLGGALGIFLSPAIIKIIKGLGEGAGTALQ